MAVSAIILAAGLSSRMGFPKALLHYQDLTLIEWITNKSLEAGVEQIIIVTADVNDGYPFKKSAALKHLKPCITKHSDRIRIIEGQSHGQPIDSLRYAIQECAEQNSILLWPVDYPFADVELIRNLFSHLENGSNRIIIPYINGKKGHPVLFSKDLKNELLSPFADQGAHHVVNRDPERVALIPVKNAEVCLNINTPEEAILHGIKLQ